VIRLGVLLFDGFDELDAVVPWEVLRTAAALGAPFETTLFTGDGARTVEASHGLRIEVSASGVPAPLDWVVVPGGGWSNRSRPGTGREIERGTLPRLLTMLYDGGVSVASICTGAMLVSAAGLLRGRPATTHAIARAALRADGAELIDARVVDDGNVVSAGGITSGIDLSLWLVERLAGAAIARATRTELEHHPVGGVHFGPRATSPTRT
jgi:transcriptional regulator GlxA family with amidase domain